MIPEIYLGVPVTIFFKIFQIFQTLVENHNTRLKSILSLKDYKMSHKTMEKGQNWNQIQLDMLYILDKDFHGSVFPMEKKTEHLIPSP